MAVFDAQDLQLTDSGDLVVSSDGDLSVATIDQSTRQLLILCIYTLLGDFEAVPSMGSKVEEFRGELNTRENANSLRSEVLRALTQGGLFSSEDLLVNIVPIAADKILAQITVRNILGLGNQTISFVFNYESGLELT
jgi:hypothetical protein